MINIKTNKSIQGNINRAIQTIVATLGVTFGIGGVGHGFFEALQGNKATNGYVIHAIGEANRMWLYGNEPAFTIIPNFLITGIAAMLVGIAVIIWSWGFMHKKHASTVFLSLFILLFLVGGGIGQVVFFMIAWAMSTCIHSPLNWWRKVLPATMRRFLSKLWRPFLIASTVLILFALQIAIFGFVPGVSNPNIISIIMVSTLGAGLLFLILAFISGCAHDIYKGGVTSE
ncbi:hypothetical protein IMX26_17180 [Clostridium sp. 'deep sea']|uniref:hypothetical protein n=1 Tax=Clostridium sp. 'deep sea' TaxID=2779445 RepID=UPI00189655FF|nr:hypothetical protein [Clostridium sp. 'deep sea']QOR35167.1 hypothetical protein IMX26_17180 [Clostridium sp. 'deep sea']